MPIDVCRGRKTTIQQQFKRGIQAIRADPDKMLQSVASDLSLHYFASSSAIFQQKYLNEHNLTSLKLKMDSFNIYGSINGLI